MVELALYSPKQSSFSSILAKPQVLTSRRSQQTWHFLDATKWLSAIRTMASSCLTVMGMVASVRDWRISWILTFQFQIFQIFQPSQISWPYGL